MQKVKVRIEGKTKSHVYNAARALGVNITKVYPMRGGNGFMGYGWTREPYSTEYQAKQAS